MAKGDFTAGDVDQSVDVFIQDSSSTIGAGLTGLVYNTASLTCYYRKGPTGSATAITLATQTVGGAHSDGGFKEIDATNMPGQYRLDLPDAVVSTAGRVYIYLRGATNMAPCVMELDVKTAVYVAEIEYTVAGTTDEWTIRWFKDGVPITSGITSPTLTVVNRAGSTVINAVTPTQIGSTGVYQYDATGGSVLGDGEQGIATVAATIDGVARSSAAIVSRDA